MIRLLLIVLGCLCSLWIRAEVVESNLSELPRDTANIYMIVDQMPEFPGGVDEFHAFIRENLDYWKALKNGVEGKVYVTFIIDTDGEVRDAKVIRGVDKDLDKEALRVVRKSPDWHPGVHKGKVVKVQYTVPIVFKLPEAYTPAVTEEKPIG